MGTPLLPSPHLLSSPMLPSSHGKYDYFKQVNIDPEKKVHFSDRKREWQDDDDVFDARDAYLTPDPSSQPNFSSSPPRIRRPLTSIPILRPKPTGEIITIGRSSIQCTHPIPQQFLNLHISRVHVLVKFVSETGELSVFCKGLNPIYVDTRYETRRVEKGREERFVCEDVKINVAGYVVIVETPQEEEEDELEESEEEDVQGEEMDWVQSLSLLPSLGPPVTIETEFMEPEKRSQGSLESSSPPISSPVVFESHSHRSSPPRPQPQDIQIYCDESNTPQPNMPRSSLSPAPETVSSPEKRSGSPSSMPSEAALLDALLTTLIFAEVKPTSLPRLLVDLSHRMPNVAEEQILHVVTSAPCVGIVRRSGKDAAGKQLPDEYYYIPESTPP